MRDICCVGHITRDKIITPERTVYMAGGTSFYFSYAINKLPKDISYQLLTKVGKEDMEEINKMRAAGIDVEVYESKHTVFFENKYGANQNHRTQRVLAKADPFKIEEMQGTEAKIYHLGSLLADDFSADFVKELSKKGRISIDAQGYLRQVEKEEVRAVDWANKREILKFTDILKLNEYEMEVIAHSSDPRKVALTVAEWGVKEVVITFGSYGSLIYADGKFYDIPAYEPTAVTDATGCGDTYSAGYLYCRALGAGCEEAGRFAAAMCSQKLSRTGPFDGTIEDIKTILNQ